MSAVRAHPLELRIPPPLVALLLAVAMGYAAPHVGRVAIPAGIHAWGERILAAAGFAFQLVAMISFRRAKTTINPLKPEDASALVTTGVFGVSRNPMYVGFTLLLAAWAVHVSALGTLLGPVAFVAWITRFQIMPEERALRAHFGAAFDAYCARVRRWL